jgi:prepilin-type processing-associated H-X9-DG protein
MKRPAAFTLIEVLVVIATIALLMAILLPILRRSRQEAEAAVCGSNISQLLKGILSYEMENQILPYSFDNTSNDPPQGGYSGNIAYDRTGWWWFNFIEDFYTKSGSKTTAVRCPSKRLSSPSLKNNILCGNYGINRSICKSFDDRQPNREEFVGEPLRSSSIPRPSETLLIVDSGYALISWWHATDEPPVTLGNTIIEDTAYIPGLWINKNRNLWPGLEQDAINGRHTNKTVNVGFADSHVRRTKADNLFVEKTDDGYKNKSPLWVPK